MAKPPSLRIIYCVYPKNHNVKNIAKALLKEKMIVCANIIPAVQSVYIWQDKVETSGEVIVLFKTERTLEKKLVKRLSETHPYDVPLIAVLKPTAVNQPYLHYLASEI